MDDDVDLIRFEAKEPVGLDHFQTLVHQRSRIDRDLCAHAPRRVAQRFRDGCIAHLSLVFSAKRTARSC